MSDASGLRRFAGFKRGGSRLVRGVVLFGGSDARSLSNNIAALPYRALFPKIVNKKR